MRKLRVDSLGASFPDRLQNVGDDIDARPGAEVALAVDAHADRAGFEIAMPEDEHGVDFHLLGAGDFGFDVVAARVQLAADFVDAQFVRNRTGILEGRSFVADPEDAALLGREPEREVLFA